MCLHKHMLRRQTLEPPLSNINFPNVKRREQCLLIEWPSPFAPLQLYVSSVRCVGQRAVTVPVCEGIVLFRLISMFRRKFITRRVALVSIAPRRLDLLRFAHLAVLRYCFPKTSSDSSRAL